MTNIEAKVDLIGKILITDDADERHKLRDALARLIDVHTDAPVSDQRKPLMQAVTDLLHEIGVPAHISGYDRLREAIIIAVNDPSIINSITKGLYPAVAEKCHTTPGRVERAIRHAIEVAWDRGDLDTIQRIFGNTISPYKGKAANSEFIALIADRLRMQGYGNSEAA